MTQPALGGAQCCGEQREARPPFASRSAFLEEFAAKRRRLLGTSQENLRTARDRSATTQDETAGTARCSGPTPPAVSLHPIRAPKTPVMTYGIKEARPLGAGRRTAGSPIWEWINDHWHASAPHLAPIHPPLRATHPSRAMDRKTVFSLGNPD